MVFLQGVELLNSIYLTVIFSRCSSDLLIESMPTRSL